VAGIEREEAVGQIFEPMLALFGVLGELGIARPARLSATTERLSARQMVQVGRLGAAQRIIEKELNTFTLPVEEARLDDYVRLCIDLSKRVRVRRLLYDWRASSRGYPRWITIGSTTPENFFER